MKKTVLATGALAAFLAVPAAASAHVTLNPRSASPGSFQRFDVRVPNERDDKGTVKVVVLMPRGVFSLSYKKVAGWKARIKRKKLPQPVDLGEFKVDERITRVTWTGNPRRGGVIRPDQFEEFPISIRVPDGTVGTALVFRALQTYQGGEVVRWTGPPDAELPAPRVTLVAPPAGSSALTATSAEALLRGAS